MKVNRLVISTVIGSLVICNIALASDTNYNERNYTKSISTLVNQSKVKVLKGKSESLENNFIKYDIQIPQISGLDNMAFQEKINKIIKDRVMQELKAFEESATAISKALEDMGMPFRPYIYKANYKVKSLGPIISIVMETCLDTGGNSTPRLEVYNIDSRSGQSILLSDLFIENANYREALSAILRQQLVNLSLEDSNKPSGDTNTLSKKINGVYISDAINFYLEDGNLVLIFPKNKISPLLQGTIEFKIPLYTIANILKEPEPLIIQESYYNYLYDFSFKLPPVWVSNLKIKEDYSIAETDLKLSFTYEDIKGIEIPICNLFVVDSSKYESFKQKNSQKLIFVDFNKEKYYLMDLNEKNKSSEHMLYIQALDGINDLFKLVNIKEFLISDKREASPITGVIINNKEITKVKEVYLSNNKSIMIPLRAIAEELGFTLSWDKEKQSVELVKDENKYNLAIGKDKYVTKNDFVQLGDEPELIEHLTFVPLEFISDILGIDVQVLYNGKIKIGN